MGVFLSTLNQMGFLILLIAVGYILVRFNLVEESGTKILSKLENYLFIPALVLSTFISNFTVKTFSTAWKFLVCGTIVVLLSAVFAALTAILAKIGIEEVDSNVATFGTTNWDASRSTHRTRMPERYSTQLYTIR